MLLLSVGINAKRECSGFARLLSSINHQFKIEGCFAHAI